MIQTSAYGLKPPKRRAGSCLLLSPLTGKRQDLTLNLVNLVLNF